MQENMIITIGRQYGSGGHEIGKILSQKLKFSFYDNEILLEASKNSDLSENVFETYDESPANASSYSLHMDARAGSLDVYHQPIAEQVYLAEFDAIKRLASENSCVFIGRCADYVLKGYKNCINIFVYASLEERIKRVCERKNMEPREAEIIIRKKDHEREKYYNYYTNQKWGNVCNYNMTLDTGKISFEDAANLIEQFVAYYKKKM